MVKMSKEKALKDIEISVFECKKCELYKTRKNPVFGFGSTNSEIFFIGEAPGRNEDLQGLPFVGRAGKLFDELLNSVDLTRKEVYITNILKCRPPKNRNPLKSEIEQCRGYLEKQIKIIKPKIIVTLGNFASSFVFDLFKLNNSKISEIHGKVFQSKKEDTDIKIIPQYHPAFAIYNPNNKKILLKDFTIIKEYK